MNSNGSRRHNRPLSSSKNPHFQNEARCTTFLVKMSFICMRMKNHFHIKGWTLNLVLIQRLGGTREWPIRKHISNIQPARLAEGIWYTKCHSSLPNIYFRLSGSYSFNSAEQVFTLHRSVAQHLSDMWLSTMEIGSAQLRLVTEIAPLEPFLCVNRSSFWYDFRGGEKATWYSVDTTLMTTCIYNALFFTVL